MPNGLHLSQRAGRARRPTTAKPAPRTRNGAVDHLRGFIIVLVVLHYAVLAYCRFAHFDRLHYLWSTAPIVDGPSWLGFDIVVLCNDSFFMPLMFLLSGLFVWHSLARKGAWDYCRDRLLRLGLPFAVAVLTVVPLAYYPSYRMTGSTIGFAAFWAQTVFSGPWPSGPAWFIGVLLAFDLAAALMIRMPRGGDGGLGGRAERADRWQPRNLADSWAWAAGPAPDRPLAWFGWLIGLSLLAYLPLLLLFGPWRWFVAGPLAVQASRIGLYALYFLAGIAIGRRGVAGGLLAPAGALQRRWMGWASAAVLLFALEVAVQVVRLRQAATLPAPVWLGVDGTMRAVFCAAAGFALLAIFLHFGQRSGRWWHSLGVNAYGIYLLHYPVVIWMQYGLAGTDGNPGLKAAIVFLPALALSWCGAMALRRIPLAARIL